MRRYILKFVERGLMAASFGPVVLAVIYGILGWAGEVESLTPAEVSTGVLTVALMAFIAGGIGVIYKIERLSLLAASLIHAAVLYGDYLLIYLLNDWISWGLREVGVFTVIFVSGYALIWLCISLSIRARTRKLNRELKTPGNG